MLSRNRFVPLLLAVAVAVAVLALARSCTGQQERRGGELGTAIGHWAEFVRGRDCQREDFLQVQQAAGPVVELAERSLASGRRLAALYRLAMLQDLVGGMEYELALLDAGTTDFAAVDVTWQRERKALGDSLATPVPDDFDGCRPLAVRAIAETAAAQVRGYFEASRDYARATIPETGLYYIGAARAERELAALARRLREPTSGEPPALRSIADEIEDLEHELLAAYIPPSSLDRSREFITAHSALQDARAFDAAGLRAAAMLRYLQCALRAAPLLAPAAFGDQAAMRQRLETLRQQATAANFDHSIAAMLLEVAEVELATAKEGTPTPAAAGIAWALPRYFSALRPATPRPRPATELTVTLVRWPFT